MATNLSEGSQILFNTINKNIRHQDYAHVIKVAKDYTTYATGIGIEEKLRQFVGRETKAAFDQRVAITQVNTPDIVNSCVKPLYKVGRTPAAIDVSWEGSDANKAVDKKKLLFSSGKNFWGKKDVTKYITQRMSDLDSTDPNSFVVVEFKENVDPKNPKIKAKPYPFEVNSAEAVNYVYKNNDLQWLVVLNYMAKVDGKGNAFNAEKYYSYFDNESITAEQIHKDLVFDYLANNKSVIRITDFDNTIQLNPGTTYLINTTEKSDNKKRYYIVKVFEHKIGFVPAKRFGTILDPATRNRTCIPVIFAAQSYFEKSIKTMSEFDITNCLHVFPQKWQYTDPCPGEATTGGFIGCQNGMRPDGKTVCGACQGSGFKVHKSAHDIIQIRMPKDLSEIVTLENMSAYKSPPMDLLKFQKDFGFYELRTLAQGAVYNSDVFSRQEIAQTAMGKSIDLDAVYDTLKSFADSWSEMFEHIYRCIAALRDIDEGLTIVHAFPNDFKMESFTSLLDNLAKANTNGAAPHIKKALNRKITHKIYIDQPDEVLRIETKDKYYPFSGKTESEVNFILANDLCTRFNKVLYANFNNVFSDIEYEQGQKKVDFYQMDEGKQRELLIKKVTEYIAQIDAEDAESAATEFGKDTPAGSEEEIIDPTKTGNPDNNGAGGNDNPTGN